MKENRDSTGWSKEKIEERFAAFVKAKGRLPVAREMNPQCELPTRRTFEQHMGMTAQEYAKQNYPELLSLQNDHHIQSVLAYRQEVREWTVERLVEAEKQFFQENGRLPEPHEYTAGNGLPMYSVFSKLAREEFESALEMELRDTQISSASSIEQDTDEPFKIQMKDLGD